MRIGGFLLAIVLAAPVTAQAAMAPKGCYEKTWSKGELKKLPLQQVTGLRLEANLGAPPASKPQAFGRLMARFRDTGDAWLSTAFECSDTGAGFACASYCDGSIFVLSSGGSGLQIMPPQGVTLAHPDCDGTTAKLAMNADQKPFPLARRTGKACPSH